MKKTLFLLSFVLLFISCSSDDNSNVPTPDSIEQTEWEHLESNRGYYIYFSSLNNEVRINHPYYDVGSDSWHNEDIFGTFTYNKPDVTMSYYGDCYNSGFVFSSCNVTATINGNILSVNDNGTTYNFTRKY